MAVDEQVREALASIRDGVAVEVRYAGHEFARIADAVVVAVGLRWVCDGGAVVDGVRATVAVGVDGWDCDCNGVPLAPGDTCARAYFVGDVALAVAVLSPASHKTIATECYGVPSPASDAFAYTEVVRDITLSVSVSSPASDAPIASEYDGVKSPSRNT